MSDGYRVGLGKRQFVNGPQPVYVVVTPDGLTFEAETRWGARHIIRMDKQARKIEKEANASEHHLEPPAARSN